MKQKKLLTSALAVGLAVVLLFGGTLAWQSISQVALNEVAASVNPGGRLHDDFNNITDENSKTMEFDKDVYVENFTDLASNGVQVYARVRLDEYMELGTGAGVEGDATKYTSGNVKSLVAGATMEDKSSWSTYLYGEDSPFRTYWNMSFGGDTVYMPTFNKNKDSLEADINGSFQNNFADHVDYTLGDESGADTDGQYIAIYDKDAAEGDAEETDEIVMKELTASQIINGEVDLKSDASWDGYWKEHIDIQEETHTAKSTINGTVMSMQTYLDRIEAAKNGQDVFDGTGNFWVYDTDGWAYWANPIDPDTATGLLLNGIKRTEAIINQDWYYAINVVAQFVTGDDLGQDNGTGFYKTSDGCAPSANALLLLNRIGVDVKFEVGDETKLVEALAHGGTVKLTNDVSISNTLTVSADTVLDLGEHTLTSAVDTWQDTKEECAMLYVDGATVIINGGNFVARENDALAVSVGNGGKVVIYGGTFKGNMTSVYVYEGEAVIYGGEFSIQQEANVAGKEYDYVLNCYDDNWKNGTAKITVCGGSFVKFDPDKAVEDTSVNGGKFLAAGYTATKNEETGVYTVSKTAAASTGEGAGA